MKLKVNTPPLFKRISVFLLLLPLSGCFLGGQAQGYDPYGNPYPAGYGNYGYGSGYPYGYNRNNRCQDILRRYQQNPSRGLSQQYIRCRNNSAEPDKKNRWQNPKTANKANVKPKKNWQALSTSPKVRKKKSSNAQNKASWNKTKRSKKNTSKGWK